MLLVLTIFIGFLDHLAVLGVMVFVQGFSDQFTVVVARQVLDAETKKDFRIYEPPC